MFFLQSVVVSATLRVMHCFVWRRFMSCSLSPAGVGRTELARTFSSERSAPQRGYDPCLQGQARMKLFFAM
ncbi:MAG: hypothetical protein EBR17_03255 [Betaproteobacteria bacterium]|nr:hypothetical protein [Betaproteobacteria bacterium]NBX91549.1 hypothetical protein [Betaproteobacteria bacterium]